MRIRKCLACFVVLVCFTVMGSAAFASDGIITVKQGESFTASLSVIANPNKAVIATVKVFFDHDVFELIPGANMSNESITLQYVNGVIPIGQEVIFEFRVFPGVPDGDYVISATPSDAYQDSLEPAEGLALSAVTVQVRKEEIPTPTPAPTPTPVPAITEAPAPAPTPTPSPTPDPVQNLEEDYPPAAAHLKLLQGEDRVMAYAGPGKGYGKVLGGYKPYEQENIKVYLNEDGWIFVRIAYYGTKDRYVYFSEKAFDRIDGEVTRIQSLEYAEGITLREIVPRWCPEDDYRHEFEKYSAEAGTKVKVFFRENGYVYAEYESKEGLVRMWLPEYAVQLK